MSDDASEIRRHRGDTKPIVFQLWEDKKNNVKLNITGYEFRLTVDIIKNPINSDNNIFALVGAIIGDPLNGQVQFNPSAENTNQEPKTYYYDFEITDAEGFIDTAALDKFKIVQDISK